MPLAFYSKNKTDKKYLDMKRLIFTLISVVLGLTGVKAVSFIPIDITDPAEPVTINLKQGANYMQITAIESNTLHFNVGYYGIMLFECNAQGEEGNNLSVGYDNEGHRIFSCEIEEGKTYYFSTSSITEKSIDVIVYYGSGEGVPITLSSNYSDGDIYTISSSNLELTFDRIVDVNHNWIEYGEESDGTFRVKEEIPAGYIHGILTTQYFYNIELSKFIREMSEDGKLKVGDKFRITLEGIHDANDESVIYGDDGNYSVTLVMGEMPGELVSVDPAQGTTLYTYYPEGGDEGLLTFTFTDDLNTDKSKVNVNVSYGDTEAGSYGSYNPDFTIEGKTVVVDLRGYRFPEKVESSREGEVQTMITMTIKGLTTADGREIITNNSSAGTNAIVVTYPLKKQEITFYYDFLPSDGSSLDGYSEIIIWLPEEAGGITFEKVQLQWLNNRGTLQTKNFMAEDVPFTYDKNYAGYVSHIPLTGVSKDREITLVVVGAMLSNGDSVEITGKFNTSLTGIDSVLGEDANAAVKLYTIDGILVKEAPAGNVLNGVKKGVYIMNGKKVVVR